MKTPEQYDDDFNKAIYRCDVKDLVSKVKQDLLDEISSFCVKQAGKIPASESDSVKTYIAAMLGLATKIRNGDFK